MPTPRQRSSLRRSPFVFERGPIRDRRIQCFFLCCAEKRPSCFTCKPPEDVGVVAGAPNSICMLPELLRRKTIVRRLSLWLARRRSDGLPYSRCHSAENPPTISGGGKKNLFHGRDEVRPAFQTKLRSSVDWWSQSGSNRRPPACKAGALPAELWPRTRQASGGSGRSCTPDLTLIRGAL